MILKLLSCFISLSLCLCFCFLKYAEKLLSLFYLQLDLLQYIKETEAFTVGNVD